ncbi:SGNH/GDSL hydrolase family protein [Alicyclobacillus shizuokensis]|uniref:SGNH/GDSL hydrolase family protein n=1 Tax=Alicyclobacillus shizuokensis TaxID=392014 RepID=UPI0008366AEA|nr:SGNH/GDSL hydrolase family protein [Alicyclobacillus shizuokensis]
MRLQAGQKLVMIGDSITDCGRQRPVGEGSSAALGSGYVALVDGWLRAAYPELGVRVVNMGIGGDTVRHLAARWQTDVLDLHPDWLSVMIGINDVWRQFDHPLQPELHVLPEEYEQTLRTLLGQVRYRLSGLVLMTPFYLEPNKEDAMRRRMDEYGRIVKRVADDLNAVFVDTQAAFDKLWAHTYPSSIALDRVHPDLAGHTVLARAFLDAVGFDFNRRGQ